MVHRPGAIKHGGKASEVAPICVWPRSRLGSGPLAMLSVLSGSRCKSRPCALHLARSAEALAWELGRAGPHPDSGILGTPADLCAPGFPSP